MFGRANWRSLSRTRELAGSRTRLAEARVNKVKRGAHGRTRTCGTVPVSRLRCQRKRLSDWQFRVITLAQFAHAAGLGWSYTIRRRIRFNNPTVDNHTSATTFDDRTSCGSQ
jgi:hypothetical protein